MHDNKLLFVYSAQYNWKEDMHMILDQLCAYDLVLISTQTLGV